VLTSLGFQTIAEPLHQSGCLGWGNMLGSVKENEAEQKEFAHLGGKRDKLSLAVHTR